MRPEIVSKLLHPVLVVPVSAFLYLLLAGLTVFSTVYWISLWIIMSFVPTVAYTYMTGEKRNLDILSKDRRKPAYIVAVLTLGLATGVMYLLSAPSKVLLGCITGLFTVIVFSLANLYSKVSIHTGATTASGVLLTTETLGGLLLIVAAPVVAWSRIKLYKHSLKETIAGGLLGIICILPLLL